MSIAMASCCMLVFIEVEIQDFNSQKEDELASLVIQIFDCGICCLPFWKQLSRSGKTYEQAT